MSSASGAKIVLGATIAFLILSFFSWFHYTGPGKDELDAIGADTGITMWHGVGWIAGLLAIGLLVWQAIRLANIELEIGVTPSMITAALALLVLIFALIRWLDKPGGDFVGRTFWSWLGLALRDRHGRRRLDEHARGGREPDRHPRPDLRRHGRDARRRRRRAGPDGAAGNAARDHDSASVAGGAPGGRAGRAEHHS